MPGRFFLTGPVFGITDPPRRNIAPGQEVIVRVSDEVRHMRWGMIPVGRVNARGRPVMETIVNARSETVFDKSAFADVGRAIVPANGWYEWTGEKRRKQPWRITRKDGGMLYFAAIFDVWNGPGGILVHQVATITCAPSADVRDIHHRMGVILTADQIDIWLGEDDDAASDLMRPLPDGTLIVEKADDVDWDSP
ncbi:SOS response-associated peptidase [Yoonia sp. SS1-5]|uniref:Abasic site processing protein n=1 Tax=Yoonia rhodophyticola TaxID=3137370 RepID=A0AAN0NIT2_9RHOB